MPLRDRVRSSPRRWPKRWSRSLFFIPICTIVVVIVLGLLRVSGSSVGIIAENDSSPQAALQLRPNRSDEWRGRTPLVLRQANTDFASETDLGVGRHDTGVLTDLPVKTPGTVLKPHSWLYFVLDVERAFAMEWWLTVLGPFLGVYALMAVLTKSPAISALSGLLVAAAPAATWWTVPSMGMSVLYGALSVAAFIAALDATGRSRFVYAAVAGWLVGCFAVLLYLPWLIPLALLYGAVALSQIRGRVHNWRRLALTFATGGGVFAIGMALYLRDHRAALSAITNSVYPGHRVTHSAGGSPVLMFDAPFDVFTTTRSAPAVYGTNQSEAASGLMLWFPVAIAGGAFAGFRSRDAAPRALAAVMTVSLVLVAWALLPVPDKLGLVLGLTNVQGSRLVLPLTVAGALAAGLYVHRWQSDGSFRPSRDRIITAVVAFAFVTGALVAPYTIDGAMPSRRNIMVLIAVLVAVTFAILNGRTALGLGGACVLLLFSAVRVNPLQIGLDPLTRSPFEQQIDAIRSTDPDARWAVSGGDAPGVSIVMASGATSVTGVSWYADPAEWHKLDPTDSQHDLWDRFAYVAMFIDDTLATTRLDLPYDDSISILTPTCNGALQALDVRYLATTAAISSACLQLVDTPSTIGERYIYTTTLTIES